MAPHGNFRCYGEDSWVSIAVRSYQEWRRLCSIMCEAELSDDERFTDLDVRMQNIDEIERIGTQWTESRNAYSIMNKLQAEDIPCAPVLKGHEVAENPQLIERDFFDRVDDPGIGSYAHAGTPWKLSRAPSRVRTPAPGLGQHSEQILSTLLGVSSEDLLSLVERGITGDTPNLDD